MKQLLLLVGFYCVATCLQAQALPEVYASQGQMILTQFNTAPFPHPKRAEGHTYQGKKYPAKEHYSDSTVAIFIPKGFRETGRVDLLVHFHGWFNDVAGTLAGYKLIDQLMASGRNVVLVVPEGPRKAPDSFGGKLEDDGGFKRFIDEVLQTLRHQSDLTNKAFNLGDIIISGHSGGYEVMSAILDRGGLTDQIKEVWLFDGLYAQADKFLAWVGKRQGRFIDIYTDGGGTKARSQELIAALKQQGIPMLAVEEKDATPSDLEAHKVIFLHTDLRHNDVLEKRQEFRRYLETSCLGKRDTTLKE